jgi:hypothetical protein
MLAIAYLFIKDLIYLSRHQAVLSNTLGSSHGRREWARGLAALLFIATRSASVLLGPGQNGEGAIVSAVRVAELADEPGHSQLLDSIFLHFAATYLFYFLYYRTVMVLAESSSLIDAGRSDSRRVQRFFQALPVAHHIVFALSVAGGVLVGMGETEHVSLVLIMCAIFKLLTILIGTTFAWEMQHIGSSTRSRKCCGLQSMVWFLCPFLRPTSQQLYLQHQQTALHKKLGEGNHQRTFMGSEGAGSSNKDPNQGNPVAGSKGGVELTTMKGSKSARASVKLLKPRTVSVRQKNKNGLMSNLNHLLSPGQRQELKKQQRMRNIVTSLNFMCGVMFAQAAVDLYVVSILELAESGHATEVSAFNFVSAIGLFFMELLFLYLCRLFHRRADKMEQEALHSKPMVSLVNGLWDYFVKDQNQKSLSFEAMHLMLKMERPAITEVEAQQTFDDHCNMSDKARLDIKAFRTFCNDSLSNPDLMLLFLRHSETVENLTLSSPVSTTDTAGFGSGSGTIWGFGSGKFRVPGVAKSSGPLKSSSPSSKGGGRGLTGHVSAAAAMGGSGGSKLTATLSSPKLPTHTSSPTTHRSSLKLLPTGALTARSSLAPVGDQADLPKESRADTVLPQTSEDGGAARGGVVSRASITGRASTLLRGMLRKSSTGSPATTIGAPPSRAQSNSDGSDKGEGVDAVGEEEGMDSLSDMPSEGRPQTRGRQNTTLFGPMVERIAGLENALTSIFDTSRVRSNSRGKPLTKERCLTDEGLRRLLAEMGDRSITLEKVRQVMDRREMRDLARESSTLHYAGDAYIKGTSM